MLKVFFASHGNFASGIKSTANILFGSSDKLTTFDAYVNDDLLTDKLDEFYQSVTEGDQVVLLSDLLGGSVNTQMVSYSTRANTFLVAGVNLAFILELLSKESVTEAELEEIAVMSREMLRVVKIEAEEAPASEDFF